MASLHAVLRDIKRLIDVAVGMINKGADINARDAEGETPLKLAILIDNADIVKHLIEKGAVDEYSITPLHIAAMCTKNVYILKLLIDAGADVDAKTKYDRETPLFNSVFSRNMETCKFLIGAGANVNEKNKDGDSILHQLSYKQVVDVNFLKFLIKAGANINARNNYGDTPLHTALDRENLTTSKILIEAGADINARNNDGETPMSYYFSTYFPIPVVDDIKFFLKAGFNPDYVFECKETALTFLIHCLPTIKRLTDYEKQDSVPLRDSIKEAEKTIQLLIAYSNINFVNVFGKNILASVLEVYHVSAKKESFYKIVLEHIAKINVLKLPIDPRLLATIEAHDDYKNYFKACVQELEKTKSTRLDGCWVTYFNLLVEDEAKLVKYAGNENLVADVKKSAQNSFPIYGSEVQDKMAEAIERRELFNEAANTLSSCCPIFGPCHLVIRDVLDTFDEDDWEKLSGKYL